MRIDRNIIHDNYVNLTEQSDRPYLLRQVNRIKRHLVDKGAVKGDLITISVITLNTIHVASVMACAELGLKIIIIDSPATEESLPYTKLALHGPSKFYIWDSEEGLDYYNGLHEKMMHRYGGTPIDWRDVQNLDPSDYNPYEVSPDDPLLMSSTSGTTKASRPILFSHREVYEISKRAIDIFKFDKHSVVCHSRNLHHASALLTSLLPALMSTRKHAYISFGHDGMDKKLRDVVPLVNILKCTHIMMPNKRTLKEFLSVFDKPFDTTLNINMSGFTIDEEFVELAEKHNVCFHSHYGSIDTAIPLLVNFVDKDSTIIPNSLGILPDDFYKTTLESGKMIVEHEWWDEPRVMDDQLEIVDGQYIITSKRESPMEIPDDVNIELFFQDTKINWEQLRGYLNDRLHRDQ